MKLFEIAILIFFSLWLLCAVWVALAGKGRLLKLRKFLWFNGWFSQWTMFLSKREGNSEQITISYRDKTEDGEIGPWRIIDLEKPWKPTIFLLNPDLRLYGFMSNAIRSFAHLQDLGRPVRESSQFDFFQSVVLSHRSDEEAEHRQIRVERHRGAEEVVLLQSEFLQLP